MNHTILHDTFITYSNWMFSFCENIWNVSFELLIYVERIDNAGSNDDDHDDDD